MKQLHVNFPLAILSMIIMVVMTAAIPLFAQSDQTAVRYEGNWEIQPNGDVQVTRQYKLPMQLYRKWRDADMHMLEFRSFASERSPVEVDKEKAEWDDMNRTMTLTMTVLGMAKNMGDHWEAKVLPGEEFSNLNEEKKIGYFHFAFDGSMGQIRGQDLIILPPQCKNPLWNESTRTINYVMPDPEIEGGGSLSVLWWILSGVSLLAGLGMFVVSYIAHSKSIKS